MADPQPPSEVPSYAHPVAAFFLVFFKFAAVFIYLFCGLLGTDFVINFCLVTFLLVCDFWTVRGREREGWQGGRGRAAGPAAAGRPEQGVAEPPPPAPAPARNR